MNSKEKLLAANILFHHKLNKTGLNSLPKNLIPKNISEAYDIQYELKIIYLTLKDNFCIGKKVGCTNKIAQEQVGIYEPFYGNLFSNFSQNTGCKLKSKKFFKPYIEPEISFKIKDDININHAPFTNDDAIILFEGILPSIEIVDFRFGTKIKDIGIKNLIMSNGASEYWIKGDTLYPVDQINLNNNNIKVQVNNMIIEEGNTNMVLGNPINSAIWLVNKLSSLGEPMLKGQYISTGTCTKAIPLSPDSNVVADFGSLGKVEIIYN